MKKTFRISAKEKDIILTELILLAAISNGNPDKRVTLGDLSSILKKDQLYYPNLTSDWKVTEEQTFLSIDKKQGEEYVNLLLIEEVEVFELEEEIE